MAKLGSWESDWRRWANSLGPLAYLHSIKELVLQLNLFSSLPTNLLSSMPRLCSQSCNLANDNSILSVPQKPFSICSFSFSPNIHIYIRKPIFKIYPGSNPSCHLYCNCPGARNHNFLTDFQNSPHHSRQRDPFKMKGIMLVLPSNPSMVPYFIQLRTEV